MDHLNDAGDGTILTLAMDLVASVFALQNTANALVMVLASIQGAFV
jgi:hypothetical protein